MHEPVYEALAKIKDPEVPVINIVELGVIRDVQSDSDKSIKVTITPTYSGCPAMDFIHTEIALALKSLGYKNVEITEQLSPPWTTDWMTEEAKEKLKNYGIAPPRLRAEKEVVQCPRCESEEVEKVSQFGSTSCKALYKCKNCLEPFDYFKCI